MAYLNDTAETYVSFETAQLLKKKFYPQTAFRAHYIDGNICFEERTRCGFGDTDIIAPTQAMVTYWLRTKYGIHVDTAMDDLNWSFQLLDVKNRDENLDPVVLSMSYAGYRSYEEATEEGIKYALNEIDAKPKYVDDDDYY